MSQLLRIDAVEVHQDAAGRYCLNDLHQAAGCAGHHQPAKFLANLSTRELIQEIARNSPDSESFPVATLAGRNGGTYVARELVYAYAMWVSAAFHLKVIRTFDAVATGRASEPEFKAPLTYVEALQRIVQLQQQLLEARAALPPAGTAAAYAAVFREDGRVAPKARELPWLSTIRTWLERHPGLSEVNTTQLCVAALGLREPTNVQRGAVGRVMRALGWARGRRRGAGKLSWVYVRPAPS